MARSTRLPVEIFERGQGPESSHNYLWLIFFGIVPYLVVYSQIKAKRMPAAAPFLIAAAGVLPGLVLLGWAPPVGLAMVVIGVGVGAGVVATIVANRRDPLRGFSLEDNGRWIVIPNASDAYANAVAGDLKAGRL